MQKRNASPLPLDGAPNLSSLPDPDLKQDDFLTPNQNSLDQDSPSPSKQKRPTSPLSLESQLLRSWQKRNNITGLN